MLLVLNSCVFGLLSLVEMKRMEYVFDILSLVSAERMIVSEKENTRALPRLLLPDVHSRRLLQFPDTHKCFALILLLLLAHVDYAVVKRGQSRDRGGDRR
jgi:hypothetical protein